METSPKPLPETEKGYNKALWFAANGKTNQPILIQRYWGGLDGTVLVITQNGPKFIKGESSFFHKQQSNDEPNKRWSAFTPKIVDKIVVASNNKGVEVNGNTLTVTCPTNEEAEKWYAQHWAPQKTSLCNQTSQLKNTVPLGWFPMQS